jgi:hypothetical protein
MTTTASRHSGVVMRARSVLAAVAAIALVAAPAAGATTKKKPVKKAPPAKTYCNVLTDVSGDGTFVPPITSKGMDILSGDIATGKKTMVAVLRIGDTNFTVTHDPWAALEYAWSMQAVSSYGQSYAFTAKQNNGTMSWGATVDGAGVAVKSFTMDTVHNTFTWVIDRSVDKTLTRKNTVFRAFSGESKIFGSSSADHAPNQATMPLTDTYPDLGRSCVHAS